MPKVQKPAAGEVVRSPSVIQPQAPARKPQVASATPSRDQFAAARPQRPSAATPVTTVAAPVVRQVTFTYDAGSHQGLQNLRLKGSFDKQTGAFDAAWGGGDSVPMKPLGDGRWQVTLPIADDGLAHDWRWGVIADGPTGQGQWAVMGEDSLPFEVGAKASAAPSYAPTTYDRMGAQKLANGDLGFRFWAPDAKAVSVKVTDALGRSKTFTLKGQPDGTWATTVPGGFAKLAGTSYCYQVTTAEGATVNRPDPYAREMQGEQRGLSREFIDVRTGAEVNPFFVQPDLAAKLVAKYGSFDAAPAAERVAAINASRAEFMRFEIDGAPSHVRADLVFTDERGHQLTKAELLARLGGPIDSKLDPSLATKLRGGQFDDLWSRHCDDSGAIHLTNEDGTWTSFVNNPERLVGLHYEFRCYDADAQGKLRLVGDTNADGALSRTERQATAENDPWDNTIGPSSGVSFRNSVITDPSAFTFTHDAAPRETDHAKWVIEQVHVGSFLGSAEDSNRSTLKDLQAKLQYFKELGVNTIELLPTNEVEGTRDWGYMGANSLATEASLGFEDDSGKWVSGTEALKRFIDAAHGLGLNVMNDVVYNHIGGDNNFLWNVDGNANPYFNWSTDPAHPVTKDTPWGAMPAYNNPHVKQFFVDHAVSQVAELHFDGLRFDFTQPIKDSALGGAAGWDLLREINRQVHYFNPKVFTAAEQFDYDPNMTRPSQPQGAGGGGFDAQWYTQFQHLLVHDNGNPSIIQQAVAGQRTDIDRFMNMLTNPSGLSAWGNAVTILSDHDEVGNAERTVNVADQNAAGAPPQWARNLTRLAAGLGFLSPGIPMFFQGDESMAQNGFKWGTPETWNLGWDWRAQGQDWKWDSLTFNDAQRELYERLAGLAPAARAADPAYVALTAADKQVCDALCALSPTERQTAALNIERKQTFEFYRDAIALRESAPAFAADASVSRLYTHNDDSVMAFERKKGDSDFVVVGSLNRGGLAGYRVPLPPGQWKQVFTSDSVRYGGATASLAPGTVGGGSTAVDLPAGGYVVFQKVGP